jgi:hypothetical protein
MYWIDKWAIIILIFMIPIALNVVALFAISLFRIIRNIYIAFKYGIKYTDQDDDI